MYTGVGEKAEAARRRQTGLRHRRKADREVSPRRGAAAAAQTKRACSGRRKAAAGHKSGTALRLSAAQSRAQQSLHRTNGKYCPGGHAGDGAVTRGRHGQHRSPQAAARRGSTVPVGLSCTDGGAAGRKSGAALRRKSAPHSPPVTKLLSFSIFEIFFSKCNCLRNLRVIVYCHKNIGKEALLYCAGRNAALVSSPRRFKKVNKRITAQRQTVRKDGTQSHGD